MPIDRGPERLREAFRAVVRHGGLLSAERTACGIALPPSHAHALALLAVEGPLTPGELARRLGLDKSSGTRLCQRLEASGHLARTRDAANARFVRVALTERGARAAARVDRSSGARHRAVWEAIPRADRSAVLGALEKLARALERVHERKS